MENKNIKIICKDCKNPFYLTPEEQGFFKKMGFDFPKRCKYCRIIRRRNKIDAIKQYENK